MLKVKLNDSTGETLHSACLGWSPTKGTWKGKGKSCAKWGWTTEWCYVDRSYSGAGYEFKKPSEVYEGKFFMPCEQFSNGNNNYTIRSVPRRASVSATVAAGEATVCKHACVCGCLHCTDCTLRMFTFMRMHSCLLMCAHAHTHCEST